MDSAPKKIWILEDDPSCVFVYRDMLASTYDLTVFGSIEGLSKAVSQPDYDLLIADLDLPDGSFVDLLSSKGLEKVADKPFLIVSSLASDEILRTCYGHGAGDYLIKPFHESALRVKIEILLAKSAKPKKSTLELDPVHKKIKTNGNMVAELTPREMQICVAIATKPELSIRKRQLIKEVWQDTKVNDGTLDVHLCNLRKKLRSVSYDISHHLPDSYKIGPLAKAH